MKPGLVTQDTAGSLGRLYHRMGGQVTSETIGLGDPGAPPDSGGCKTAQVTCRSEVCGTTDARSHLEWQCLLWYTEDLGWGGAYRQGLQLGAWSGSQSARARGPQGSLSSGVPACGLKASALFVARAPAPPLSQPQFPHAESSSERQRALSKRILS